MIAYVIPDTPRDVKEDIREEYHLISQIILKTEIKRVNKAGENNKATLDINTISKIAMLAKQTARNLYKCAELDDVVEKDHDHMETVRAECSSLLRRRAPPFVIS